MSIETFPSTQPDTEPVLDPRTIDDIDTIDSVDTREVSPTAVRLQRAANRVSAFLENRAVAKAYNEALTENTARDQEAQDTAFASYEENVTYSQDHEAALKINRRFDRNKEVKQRIGDIGSRGLSYLKAAGEISLGIGIIGAEAAASSAKSASETVALGAMYGVDRVKSAGETVALAAMLGADATRDKVTDFAAEKIDATKQSYEQAKGSVVTFLQEKRDAAANRKTARLTARQEKRDARLVAKAEEAAALEQMQAEHEVEARAAHEVQQAERAAQAEAARARAADKAHQSTARKQARREKIAASRDRASELWQTAQTKRRAIGGRALTFINRTRASGQAAAQTWRNYGEQNQV